MCMRNVLCVSLAAAFAARLHAAPDAVDAISSATVNNTCKIVVPIVTTSTSATIKWTEGRTDGNAAFCYGLQDPPATCRAVTANERAAKTINLTGLQPATTYYVRYEATKSGEIPYAATGVFTTEKSTAVQAEAAFRNSVHNAHDGLLAALGKKASRGDRVIVCDIQGRTIAAGAVGEASLQSALSASNKRGSLIISLQRQGRSLACKRRAGL